MELGHERRFEKGIGVIEAVIAAALLALVTKMMLSSASLYAARVAPLEYLREEESLRNYVREFLNCERTFDPTPTGCASGAYIDTRQKDQRILTKAQGTAIGGRVLRARCQGEDLHFEVDGKSLFNGIPITCSVCRPSDVLTFETLPGGGAPTRGMEISSQFLASHGLTFQISNGLFPVLAERNRVPPLAWVCDNCGDWNRARNAATAKILERFSLTYGYERRFTYPVDFLVNYRGPVKEASGYLVDIDNSERWTIVPQDASGNALPTGTWSYYAPMGNMRWNGLAMFWFVRRPTADIHSLRFIGRKGPTGNWALGLALDRFSPAKVCP